jgi:serine/threonine protein kinase
LLLLTSRRKPFLLIMQQPSFYNRLVNDRYRILRRIGRGGMGAVYEAVDERLEMTVALKECSADAAELRLQFGREARLLASLKHRALPRVFDYFMEGDKAFLTMEFVDGPSLAEVLQTQDSPFAPARVIAWADQLLDVLIYLHGHDRQVIHRDIKPHNLKLTESGEVVLLDFGLAKSEGDTGRSVHGFTRRYSPIEQIRDHGTSQRSDLYALGATLYQLLTGVKPEDAEERDRLIRTDGEDPLRRADEVLPIIGKELAGILEQALALNEQDRFESAVAFRAALQKLGRMKVGYKSSVNGSPRRSGSMAAAIVAAVLILGAGAVYINRTTSVSAPVREQGPVAEIATTAVATNRRSTNSEPAEKRSRRRPEQTPRVVKPAISKAPPPKAKVIPVRRAEVASHRRVLPDKVPNEKRRPVVQRRQEKAVPSPTVLRAPNGTEVVRYPDGRLRVYAAGGRLNGGRQ